MGAVRSLIEKDRHDGDAVACVLAPVNHAAGVFTTPTVTMRGYERCLFCILGGAALDAASTLDVVVHQCTQAADGGGDAKVLAGLYGTKAIAQVTAGSNYATLNQKWLIEVATEEMDVDAGFDFLLLSITISAADTWYLAVEAQRSIADYEPVATTNITQAIGTTA